jgi:NAD(P)-dependent dehydrogenase (short-subunit alcohol dehydrogenase family)
VNQISDGDRSVSLRGRAVIVTGAASGLGRACADVAARRGASLLLVDRDGDRLREVAGELEAPSDTCDLSDVAVAPRLVDRCRAEHGAVDGLVNAAGIFQTRPLLDITPEDFDRMVAVNLRAVFFMQQAAARAMSERGRGSIVNLSSTAGRVGRPHAAHYAAVKAGVIALTRSAAMALAPSGVRVNALCPGLIETPMIDRIRHERSAVFGTTPQDVQRGWEALIPMGRLGTAEDVAEAAAFLLSDAAAYVTGENLGINGGTDAS